MGRPKGMKRKKNEIEQGLISFHKTMLIRGKRQFNGEQIIENGNYKSIIHWDALSSHWRRDRKRRVVQITCGKCKIIRWCEFNVLKKQIKKPFYTGLCSACFKSTTWLEKGRPRPERRKIISSGYVKIYNPKSPMADCRGDIYEHRLVMSQMLGRPLKRWEHVHHKDGNRSNNSPENLELVSTQQNNSLKDMVARIKYLENLLVTHKISF